MEFGVVLQPNPPASGVVAMMKRAEEAVRCFAVFTRTVKPRPLMGATLRSPGGAGLLPPRRCTAPRRGRGQTRACLNSNSC